MRMPLDTNVRAARMLEAGRVTVTFRSPSGSHITVLAKCRTIEDGKWIGSSLDKAKVIMFEVPNAGGEYGDKIGKYSQGRGFVPAPNADSARVYCALALLAHVAGQPTNRNLEIMVSNRCGACGRELTDPESIEIGIGPICRGDEETSSQHQVKVRPEAEEVKVPERPTTEEEIKELPILDPATLTDKRGRPLPRSFEELAAAVKR